MNAYLTSVGLNYKHSLSWLHSQISSNMASCTEQGQKGQNVSTTPQSMGDHLWTHLLRHSCGLFGWAADGCAVCVSRPYVGQRVMQCGTNFLNGHVYFVQSQVMVMSNNMAGVLTVQNHTIRRFYPKADLSVPRALLGPPHIPRNQWFQPE